MMNILDISHEIDAVNGSVIGPLNDLVLSGSKWSSEPMFLSTYAILASPHWVDD